MGGKLPLGYYFTYRASIAATKCVNVRVIGRILFCREMRSLSALLHAEAACCSSWFLSLIAIPTIFSMLFTISTHLCSRPFMKFVSS